MLLVGVSRLNIESQLVWVDTMETAVESEVVNILNDVESVDVRIEIESQNLQSSQSRSLQEDSPSPGNLTILFDVDFFIRAAVEDHDVKRYIGGTLDSEADKETFIAKLKAEDPINFASLIYVTLTLPQDTTESGILVEPANYDSEALGAGITVGIAAIGLAGVSLFVIAVYWWNRRRTDNSQSTPSTENNRIRNLFEYEQNTLTVEVSEKPELDVSTLGDPIPYNAPAPMDVSLAEETLSLPYDYKIATAQAMPSLDESASYSGFSDMSSNIIDVETDDGTLDAQYNVEDRIEVEVPPGMLGLVLEADSEGVATVYDMKELSPLEQIRIGDRLVSVDHVDVTAMSVGSVMKLIASKRNKPIRKLVFTRSPRRSSSSKLASWNRDGGDGDEED